MRPELSVFVGSSLDARVDGITDAFIEALNGRGFAATPWWVAPEFRRESTPFEALRRAADTYDYGLFILPPGARARMRHRRCRIARDTIWFQFGLFLGQLGPEHVVAVGQEPGGTPRTPGDPLGVTIPCFSIDSQRRLAASVKAAIAPLIARAERHGARMRHS